MRLFNIAVEMAPFCDGTGSGAEVASMLGAFTRRGHDVHAVVPVAHGADLSAFSLARRLKPIQVGASGRDVRFVRFEGRLPSGVNANVLMPSEPLDREALLASFPSAAAEVMRAVGGEGSACIAWGGEVAEIAALDSSSDFPVASSHLLALRGGDAGFEAWLEDGRAVRLPIAVDAHPPLGAAEKSTAKASLQAAFGLPVRADVPLAVLLSMPEPLSAETLADLLRGDVQAVLPAKDAEDGPLAALAKRYPDRLAIVPEETPRDVLLAGADLCVSGDARATVHAFSFGAVPVAVEAHAEGAVDLEPSLLSGLAFLVDDFTARSFGMALGRGAAAFRFGRPFRELQCRIQGRALSFDACAERLEECLLAG